MIPRKPRLIRSDTRIKPDKSRVLLRPYNTGNAERARHIIARVMALPEAQVDRLMEDSSAAFSARHRNFNDLLLEHYDHVAHFQVADSDLSNERKRLIGSYFFSEFSLESAALFNPSMVPHPDQSNLASGVLRFVLSLRATGEGHVSCLSFREGTIDAALRIEIKPPTRFVVEPKKTPNPSYEKQLFDRKLYELGLGNDFSLRVMKHLGSTFALDELGTALSAELKEFRRLEGGDEHVSTAEKMRLLAESNRDVQFLPAISLSERTIFPTSPSQSNGIEDARFVRFDNEDGTFVYYATMTAFDGRLVVPELVETRDFLHFRFITLNGPAAGNKGMALFPRRVNGLFTMISRQDNENIFLMHSDNIHFWHEARLILRPTYPWEFVQLGNCGSPIETDAGWLVLSHGVGPMRQYCIGAFLLDLKDPSKVIGRLRDPIITPNEIEREGYVPNVVYSCGALIHNEQLIIPYAMSDHASGFATVPVKDVLAAME